jgi:hypothetical protein
VPPPEVPISSLPATGAYSEEEQIFEVAATSAALFPGPPPPLPTEVSGLATHFQPPGQSASMLQVVAVG